MMGGHPSVGWQGCAPHVLNHQWVRVGGVLCVWWGGGGMVGGWGWVGGWRVGVWGMGWGGGGGGGVRVGRGLVEGRGSVKWGGDKESWAYTGLEDGWWMEGARGETVNDRTSGGGGRGTKMEGVVYRECHWKGPEGPCQDEGGKGGGGSIATGLGRKPMGGCYSAEMRPAIRSTAHETILWREPKWKVWLTGGVTGRVQKAQAGLNGERGEEGVRGIG